MTLGQTNRPRLLASLALAVLVALLGLALCNSKWQPGDNFLRASYDSLHSWRRSATHFKVSDRNLLFDG